MRVFGNGHAGIVVNSIAIIVAMYIAAGLQVSLLVENKSMLWCQSGENCRSVILRVAMRVGGHNSCEIM